MVAGNWLNNDGLWLQYGTQKAVPEWGGDYQMYGPWRELEVLISAGAFSCGTPAGQANTTALPTSFQGTVASQTAAANTGIVSYTTFFPLQPTAPVNAATAGGVLTITNPQLMLDQIDIRCLTDLTVTGAGTGVTGIGLVVPLPVAGSNATAAWAQVTPNAGVQLLGSMVNAKWVKSAHYIFLSDATQIGTASGPVAGSWLSAAGKGYQVPLTTLSEAFLPGGLPNNAYISAIVAGGQYTGATEGGLMLFSVRYRQMFTINDATQI